MGVVAPCGLGVRGAERASGGRSRNAPLRITEHGSLPHAGGPAWEPARRESVFTMIVSSFRKPVQCLRNQRAPRTMGTPVADPSHRLPERLASFCEHRAKAHVRGSPRVRSRSLSKRETIRVCPRPLAPLGRPTIVRALSAVDTEQTVLGQTPCSHEET